MCIKWTVYVNKCRLALDAGVFEVLTLESHLAAPIVNAPYFICCNTCTRTNFTQKGDNPRIIPIKIIPSEDFMSAVYMCFTSAIAAALIFSLCFSLGRLSIWAQLIETSRLILWQQTCHRKGSSLLPEFCWKWGASGEVVLQCGFHKCGRKEGRWLLGSGCCYIWLSWDNLNNWQKCSH